MRRDWEVGDDTCGDRLDALLHPAASTGGPAPFTVLARIQDGLVTDYIDYGDRDQALEAAGLRE